MADRHRVAAPVWHRLGATDVAAAKRMAALHNANHSVTIHRALSDAGLRAIVLKGAVLAQRLYSDASARDSKDIDILVAPADFTTARAVMAERFGFAPSYAGLSEAQIALDKDVSLAGSTLRIELELHRRLFDLPRLLPIDFDDLWTAREQVSVGGVALPVLGFAHEFLFLCGHGAAHAWFRLKWVQDIARMLLIATDEQAEAIAALTRTHRLEPLVTSSIDIAADLLGALVPPPLAGLPRDSASRALTQLAHRALSGPGEDFERPPIAWIIHRAIAQTRFRRDPGYRAAVLAHSLVSSRDRAMLALPAWAWPLYLPLKPVLYGWRRLRA